MVVQKCNESFRVALAIFVAEFVGLQDDIPGKAVIAKEIPTTGFRGIQGSPVRACNGV